MNGFSAFNATEKAALQRALPYISDIINLNFVEAADNHTTQGRMLFANSSTISNSTWAYTGWNYNTQQVGGHYPLNYTYTLINTNHSGDTSSYDFGSFDFMSIFHELGRTLGMTLPGDYGPGASYSASALYQQDSWQYTVMSYFEAANTGAQHHGYYGSTPLLHDVSALQAIYGANTSTRTGNTTYGFNNNSGRAAFDFTVDTHPVVAIWDAGGTDTIDLSGYSMNCKLDLNQGAFSDVGGMIANLSICYNAVIENGIGGSDDDQIIGNSANNGLYGGGGDDVLTAGTGNDALDGGSGDDTLVFGANFTSGDTANGGTGNDTLSLSGNYSSLIFGAGSLSSIETISLAAGGDYDFTLTDLVGGGITVTFDGSSLNSGDAFSVDGSLDAGGALNVIGGASADSFVGTSGNDTFQFNAGFSALDQVNGGGGNDTLVLSGNLGAVNFGTATMTNVETLRLGAGFNYNLTLNDANVASGATLVVDGSGLGAGDALIFRANTDTNGIFSMTGGAGADTLYGGAMGDTIRGGSGDDVLGGDDGADVLVAGVGVDKLMGGTGNDILKFGADFAAADIAQGDASTDTLMLDGEYALTMGAGSLVGIEIMDLAASHNYDFTLNDANVAAGATLTVDATALSSANRLTLDASADTNGNVIALGGAGADVATFGAAFVAGDQFAGGAGSDTLVLAGTTTIAFAAATMTGVETVQFAAGHDFDVTLNDANVAAGATLVVDGSALGAADTLTFRANTDTNSIFSMTGGAGADTLYGGAMGDTVSGGAGNDVLGGADGNDVLAAGTGVDKLLGGTGNDVLKFGADFTAADVAQGDASTDTLMLDGEYAMTMGAGTLVGIEIMSLAAGHNYAFTFDNANVGTALRLTVDGSLLGASNKLTLNGAAELDGKFTFTGGAGDDALTGGLGMDIIEGGAGNDALNGGGQHDVLTGGLGADLLTGGSGNDYFDYASVAESTSVNYDTLAAFDATGDKLDIFGTVNAIDAAVSGKKIVMSAATFDADLSNWADAQHLHAGDAVVVTAKKGTLAGHSFLVVDCNGAAGYQAGQDLVLHLDHAVHLSGLSVGTFI